MLIRLCATTALSIVIMAHSAVAKTPTEITIYPDASPTTVGSGLMYGLENTHQGSLTGPSLQHVMKEFSHKAGAVDVVPSEEFKNSYALNFADMLKDVPGVVTGKRYGEEVRLSIRGSGISRGFHLRGIQLFQDGVPLNSADGAGDFQEVDSLFARYLEVFKGGNALQYGATTLGGAINLVSPTGITAPSDNQLRVEYGSYGTVRTHAGFARRADHVDMYSAVTGVKSQGWREHSEQLTGRLNTNVGIKVNDDTETRFFLTYNNINQEVPGTISRFAALNTPKSAPAANLINDFQRDIRSLRFANKTTWKLSDSELLEISPYVALKDLNHPISVYVDQRSVNYGISGRYVGDGELAKHRNRLIAGSNVRAATTSALTYTNVRGSRGVRTGDANQLAHNYEVFAENQWYATPEFSIIAGGQGVLARRENENRRVPANSDTEYFKALSPKFGVLWDVAPAQQIFANVSKSYEPPTFSELTQGGIANNFALLSAQKAWTAEAGTRGSAARIAWDATVFHSRVQNELLNFDVGAGIPAATFNANKTIHQGLELGLDGDIGYRYFDAKDDGKLLLRQTYTYSDFRFDNDRRYGDNQIAGVPEHMYRAELQFQSVKGWKAGPSVDYVPQAAFVDYANTQKSTGYALWNVSTSYTIIPGVEWYIDARNLADKRYISNFSTVADARTAANLNVYYPGEGRSVYTGVSYRF